MTRLLICLLSLGFSAMADFPNRVYDCGIYSGSWSDVPAAGGFFAVRDSKMASKATSFKAAWTPEALRVLVRCEEPQPDKLKAERPDGGNLWEEDAVELFLARPQRDVYSQFIANAAGSRYQGLNKEKTALGPWSCAASKDARGYALEFDIPFSLLGGAPKPGEVWRFNVGRDDTLAEGVKFSTWAFIPPGNGFHSVDSFGFLRFVDGPAAAAPAVPTELLVERFHQWRARNDFDAEVGTLARFLRSLPPDVARDPAMAKLGDELAARRAAFQKIRETASAAELRGHVEAFDSLRARTHLMAKRLCLRRLFPSAEMMARAKTMVWESGGRAEAARLLRELSGVPAFRAEALLHLGICHQLVGEYSEALSCYGQVLDHGGFITSRALIRSAECLAGMGRKADALDFYGRALLMPDIAERDRRLAEAGFRSELDALRSDGETVGGGSHVLPALKTLLLAALKSDVPAAAAKIAALDAEFPGGAVELETQLRKLSEQLGRLQAMDMAEALQALDAVEALRLEISLAGKRLFLTRLMRVNS